MNFSRSLLAFESSRFNSSIKSFVLAETEKIAVARTELL
jgi:hypothetical protein